MKGPVDARPASLQSPAPTPAPARATLLGVLAGIACVFVWGGQAVVSRMSVLDGLTAADVAFLRFAAAGIVLLPWAVRRPAIMAGLGRRRAAALTLLVGTPYSLILIFGISFAPAIHQSTMTGGLIPVVGALLAWRVFGDRPTALRLAGLALAVGGLVLFAWEGLVGDAREGAWRGHVLFAAGACMWATFGTLLRAWAVDAVAATVAVSVLSLGTLPLLPLLFPMNLLEAPLSAVLLQAVYQGLLVGVVALFLYARVVTLLGPAPATLFIPLNPIVAAVLGDWLLSETPTVLELAGMAVVIVGLAAAFSAGLRRPPAPG